MLGCFKLKSQDQASIFVLRFPIINTLSGTLLYQFSKVAVEKNFELVFSPHACSSFGCGDFCYLTFFSKNLLLCLHIANISDLLFKDVLLSASNM